jgi:tetratricopeptide (TPR) repeat protein
VENWEKPLLEEAEELSIDFSEEDIFVSPAPQGADGTGPGDVEPATGMAIDDLGGRNDSESPTEIDLELEISDDELAGLAEFYSEATAADQVSHYQDDESGPTALPVNGPPVWASPSEQELFSSEESESLDLEIDFSPGIEHQDIPSPPGKDKNNGLFSGFKRGLDEQLEQGDTETRYNLGIAFMEMGLYDEAIAEFAAAAADPHRRIDCITLQGVCCRDKGDYAGSEEIFKNGISLTGVTLEEQLSIMYELALLYEIAGRNDDAIIIYRQIQAEQNDFRDTKEKLARLQGGEDFFEVDLVELESEDAQ